MTSRLLKSGITVTVSPDKEISFHGAIAIKDDRITEVGPTGAMEAKHTDCERMTGLEGRVTFLGFTNAHNHLFQTLLRGLEDGMVLKDWLGIMTFPAATNLTPDDCYHGTMLGLMEGIHSGITISADYMCPHPRERLDDGVIKAMRKLGIRGIFGRSCVSTEIQYGVHPDIAQQRDDIEKDVRDISERYRNCDNGCTKVWVAPAAMWSNTRETLQMLWKMASEYKSGIIIYISETELGREAAKGIHGLRDIDAITDMGICGPNVLMVHCMRLADEDIEKIGKHDLKISHNVCSDMYLLSGVAPIPELLKAGVTCSLGVDRAVSNNANDMIELMKSTALLQKCATRDPLSMLAEKVAEMATINDTRAIEMEKETGPIEAGRRADMAIFDLYECVKVVPLHSSCFTLVYSASLKNITDVYVDGRVAMEKGVILTVKDEKTELQAVQKAAEELCMGSSITNRLEGHKWNDTYGRYEKQQRMVKNGNLAAAIIKPDYVLTPEGLKKGWSVRIEEERIACVDSWDTLGSGSNEEVQTVCSPGQMFLPGLVNGHNHIYDVLSHGITAGTMVTGFSDYLEDFWWPYVGDRVDHDLARITTRQACVEVIDSGITSFVDILEGPNSIPGVLVVEKREVEKVDLRDSLLFEACGRKSGENGRLSLKEDFDFARVCSKENGLVKGTMSIHILFTCDEDFIRETKRIADEAGCLLHMYMSKSDLEPAWAREHLEATPMEAYDGMEYLDENVLVSQLVQITDKGVAILTEKDVDVTSMPLSNCKMGRGITPIEKMLGADMTVGLGTDGYVNNFFEVMYGAFLIHKGYHKGPQAMPARKVYRMAAEFSAKTVGIEAGIIEEGMPTDLITMDVARPTLINEYNVYDQLVLFTNLQNVTNVTVGGAWPKRGERLVTLDKETVHREMGEKTEKF